MTAIESIKSVLSADAAVSLAYLFGSRAKGETSNRADWDIAVYLAEDRLAENPIWDKFKIEDRLSAVLATDAVEVVVLNRLEDPLLGFEIIANSLLLVEKDENLRIAFEGNALAR
ncbi:MAG: hypothetical protein A2V83_05560, partial [Nitrospirae bacterium RBG_16_64_22]